MHTRKPKIDLTHEARIQEALKDTGFAAFKGASFNMHAEMQQSLDALVASFDDLPPDQYDATGLRKRRYGRFVYIPWADVLLEQPSVVDSDGNTVVEYFQPLSLNSVDGGKRRPFTPLHPVTRSNRALHELIRFDYWSLPERHDWNGMPITVGVHQISLAPNSSQHAVSSPDHLHQDGEPFTYVHLMRRKNVAGGTNYIAGPECAGFHPRELEQDAILAKFTLAECLDSFVVDDSKVSHHVDEVFCIKGQKEARRDVFLIDFTPNMPQFV